VTRILRILKKSLPENIKKGYLDFDNPYELFVGVILSAQSTDKKVNQLRPRFIAHYPDFRALARADLHELQKTIFEVGFYRVKSAYLLQSAMLIVEKFGGKLPDTMEELTTLPGIGRKSAGVILARIYSVPAIIVDTHFLRVNKRLGIGDGKDPKKLEELVAKCLPKKDWIDYSMYINAHGRLYCKAKKPDCRNCPLGDICPGSIG
jgi:endonuclease-3